MYGATNQTQGVDIPICLLIQTCIRHNSRCKLILPANQCMAATNDMQGVDISMCLPTRLNNRQLFQLCTEESSLHAPQEIGYMADIQNPWIESCLEERKRFGEGLRACRQVGRGICRQVGRGIYRQVGRGLCRTERT